MSKAASRFIDLYRALATILVVFYHSQNVFINHGDIMTAPHAWWEYVWWYFASFSLGHAAVVVFFVISGYLVGGPIAHRLMSGKRALGTYALDRSIRIYIVLLPVLALTAVLDWIGRNYFNGWRLYDIPAISAFYTWPNFWATVASLQGVWFAPFGSNGPLWSLGYEFWYYLIFPLLLTPWATGYSKPARFGLFALGVGLLVLLVAAPSYAAFAFLTWLVGAGVRFAPRPLMKSRWLALLLWLVPMLLLRFVVRLPAADAWPVKHAFDLFNALLFGNLLLTLHFDTSEGFSMAKWRYGHFGSSFSYSYYALHMPALILIGGVSAAIFGPDWRTQTPTGLHYLWTIGVIIVMWAAAIGLGSMTEFRTEQARALVRRMFAWVRPTAADQAPRV